MTTPEALGRFNAGVARARQAYDTDQRTPEDIKAARQEYERRRHQDRKKKP